MNDLPTTRLAPSPTGALHLGNARTFLVTWLMARQRGWRVVLRVEDLDGPRVKAGAAAGAIADLRWLGLDWDGEVEYQSARRPTHAASVARLLAQGDAYYCACSRREVDAAAGAPHAEDGAAVYPGTCRGRFATIEQATVAGKLPAVRFRVPDGSVVAWADGFAGPRRTDVNRDLGDFVIAKGDGTPAYQLAVVADDAAAGVTAVVRGDDLLDSVPRQVLLYRALGIADRLPSYWHLPLVLGPDGRRLAKRHGDSRLARYRSLGIPPARLLTLLARWCGLSPAADPTTVADLLPGFDLARLPAAPVRFSTAEDEWLRKT